MKRFFAIFFCLVAVAASADDAVISRVSRIITPAPAIAAGTDRELVAGGSDNSRVLRDSPSPAAQSGATTAVARTGASQVSRAGVSTVSRGAAVSESNNIQRAAAQSGRSARTEAASMNSTPGVRRAGVSLRPSTAEVGGRAIIGNTGKQTGSNLNFEQGRAVSARASKETLETMKATAETNATCIEQYTDCLDQFCNTIDANQKRCSCSARLSNYSKVESAVKEANEQLNDVAQRIRYVGLSADEIRAIMNATEAELALSGTRDTTESRSMLDEIEKMIKSPGTFVADGTGDSGLDLDLDFSADAADLFSLDMFNTSGSFSNLRGTELYSAAKKRCNAIYNACKNSGGNVQQLTAKYDIEIDKDCIAYEKGLEKMNATLKTNVRSANNMLQKARLAVLQNANTYDAKGCVGALDACMTDEMVCGSDYYKCIDPSKQYIDENGNVILGQDITKIPESMSGYNNAQISEEWLKDAQNECNFSNSSGNNNGGKCVAKYLLTKIGTGNTAADGGLCRAVLDKCRRISYDASGVYKPYNEVVVNYIQRAMVNVKAAQQQIIANYAGSCMSEISACYNQQISQVNAMSSVANVSYIQQILRGACRNVALTCGYAVFDKDECYQTSTNKIQSCTENAGTDQNKNVPENIYIDNISELFYQSLLCPTNSTYEMDASTKICYASTDSAIVQDCSVGFLYKDRNRFMVNNLCVCNANMGVSNGQCVFCPANSNFNVSKTALFVGSASLKAVPIKGCECVNVGVTSIGGSCPSS